MIEEYDHRHQLYVFYFSIFMPSFHLFPVGLFSYFQIWISPTINRRKKKTILTCKSEIKGLVFGLFFLNSYRHIDQNVQP